MVALIRRVLRVLFRHRLGPFFLALLLLLIGTTIGLTSHQVTYQRLEHVKIIHYLSGSGANKADLIHYFSGSGDNTAYIQLEDHSLYILKLSEFNPTLNANNLQSPMSTLIYEPQDTQEIDVSATNTQTHLAGSGAQVVQLISYGADGSAKNFNSTEYTQNPHGFYRNNWIFGAYFMGAGIILAILLFFFARHRISGSTGTMPVPTVYAAPKTNIKVTQSPDPQQHTPLPTPQQGPISLPGFPPSYPQPASQQGPISMPGLQPSYPQPASQQGPISLPGFPPSYQQATSQQGPVSLPGFPPSYPQLAPQQGPISLSGLQHSQQQPAPQQGPVSLSGFPLPYPQPAPQQGPISLSGLQPPYQQPAPQQGPISLSGFPSPYSQPTPQQGPVSPQNLRPPYPQPTPQQFNFPPVRSQDQQLDFPQSQQLDFPQLDFAQNPQPPVIPQRPSAQQAGNSAQGRYKTLPGIAPSPSARERTNLPREADAPGENSSF